MPANQQHLLQQQPWVIEQERARHEEVLFLHGEYSLIILMWDLADQQRGYISRCTACYASLGKISDAYGQPSDSRCPDCYGTTWEGGWKARILRPTLWDFTDSDETLGRRGEGVSQSASVQFPWDFHVGLVSYVVRSDGSRWKVVDQPQGSYIRAGFGQPTQPISNVALSASRVIREDPNSIAYDIPPDNALLLPMLQDLTRHYPVDTSDIEVIRAPLL